ncbi:uncharacterized protein LOC117326318 [Pecten maximus]|uniref:uncharacterized protein LOC117326318 n=1 Tax=Pecten maximus TaxID=6579 RepID=UPI001458915C|nr:uncharacterized protein LOC117326318 [Pecten maximus]
MASGGSIRVGSSESVKTDDIDEGQENRSDDRSDDISNDQDMLVSAGATTESSARHVADISARVRPENDETSGDPMRNATHSSCQTSNVAPTEQMMYYVWVIMWIAYVFAIFYNCYNPAPYDVEDPCRQCTSIVDSVSNLPVQSQRYYEVDERDLSQRRRRDNLGSQPESDPEEQASLFEILRRQQNLPRRQQNHPRNDENNVIRMQQLHSGTRDMSVRCQGVPHGGDEQNSLSNTCPLDQFLNGLHQICRSPPFRNLLQSLAESSPTAYGTLLEAIFLCDAGLFAEAKLKLVPNAYNLLSAEGLMVMPLIENQLRRRITKICTTCKHCSESTPNQDIILFEFNASTGFQEALTSTISCPTQQCSQPGCDGQTTVTLRFESGRPALIIAANLQFLSYRIPNSHLSEIVNLCGERYMPFLLTLGRREDGSGIPGHYMSYVFRPDEGGNFNRNGIPVGNWYFFPNNRNGDLEPWSFDQEDPGATSLSFIYFIQIPPSSSVGATSGQREDSPNNEGDANEE